MSSAYSYTTVIGVSSNSWEDAVQTALEKAREAGHKGSWFEVGETRGRLDDGEFAEWQVAVRIGHAC